MQVLDFLLKTLFFFLIGAALLRAWMNQWRIQMSVQPGRFVIAATDWLVKPLRRLLPRALMQSRIDWGSLLAAMLMALAYAGLWLAIVVQGGSTVLAAATLWLAIGILALKMLAFVVLQGLMLLLLLYAVLSWVQPQAPAMSVLERLCGPLLRPVRRFVPTVGGLDLSVLVLLVLLQVGLIVLN
ncbi:MULTISPECIES: YggT family protein [Hydrogenophaga]|uniref:Membrane protein n=1 Tax=Hydrogenophaga electricum TaxID=1230953 RepID=A0ABQ6C2C3_9BURK|nr:MULTISPECIES: YggT family protein [Hydrogenophaga]GLS12880.1 membrane protein [Hydrogenophaga electricum]